MTQHREIARREAGMFQPKTMEDMEYIATKFSESKLCPEAYRGRPADCFVIVMSGQDMGLTPSQSFRVLGSINGVPFVYGDGLTALMQRHADYDGMVEWFEGSREDGTLTAYCTIKRKGKPDVTNHYSMDDARRAGLLSKPVWNLHMPRMLQRRARSYTVKDQFGDAILGLITEDEAMEIKVQSAPIQAESKGNNGLREILGVKENAEDCRSLPKTAEVVDAEIVESESVILEKSLLDQLTDLIVEKGISDQTIETWNKKAKVESIDQMTDEMLTKCINHLKRKESKNGIQTTD